MSKRGVIRWNADQLKSIKRDLLFFDNFFYDPFLLKLQLDLLENVARLSDYKPPIIGEINATVQYLVDENILQKFYLNDFKSKKISLVGEYFNTTLDVIQEYDLIHKQFLEKHDNAVNLLANKNPKGYLEYVSLLDDFNKFADYHLKLSTAFLEKETPDTSFVPIIKNLEVENYKKEVQVIRLLVNKLPIPDDITPLDEVLDFKNDNQNRRRYLGLISWLNKISKTDLNIKEIEDLTLEFENRMKLEKQKYDLTKLEVIIALPFQIAEKLIKIKWGEIPKTLFQIKKDKMSLLINETVANGKEMAYIIRANEKFNA